MYRGILMPLSSDGDTIDYIYGVINWKEVADQDTAAGIAREAYRAAASLASAEASPVWADGPSAAGPNSRWRTSRQSPSSSRRCAKRSPNCLTPTVPAPPTISSSLAAVPLSP